MGQRIHRRRFIAGSALGTIPGVVSRGADASLSEGEGDREVRLEHLRPREIERAMKECPVLFQPLGTIEWHGYHNIVGLDALKAHMLCVSAARRGGGLVAPPLFGGVGGLG